MADNRRARPADNNNVTLRVVDGFDHAAAELSELAERADVLAGKGNTLAYDEISAFVDELIQLVIGDRSRTEKQGKLATRRLSADACIALKHNDVVKSLREPLQLACSLTKAWRPEKRTPDSKPLPAIRELEDVEAPASSDTRGKPLKSNEDKKLRIQIQDAFATIYDQLIHMRLKAVTLLHDQSAFDVYFLDRLNDDAILVHFDGERGLLKGRPGLRLARLIQEERIKVLDLGDNALIAHSSPVVASQDEIDFDADMSGFGETSLDVVDKHDIAELYQRLARIDEMLEGGVSQDKSDSLSSERDQLTKHIDSLVHSQRSTIENARGKVDRGIRKLVKQIQRDMPRFVAYVKGAQGYDKVRNEFTFTPAQRFPWKFQNFN